MKFRPPLSVTDLVCMRCGSAFPHGNRQTCALCGPEGILDVRYNYDAAASAMTRAAMTQRPRDLWRYAEVLPVSPDIVAPPLHIGWTPVHEVPRLARAIGAGRLFLKDDGRNPTSSFKDRASAVGIMKAMEFGAVTVACASTGNAASSLAGLSAATGLRSVIFVPERTPEPKVIQLLIFGATVISIQGTYEQAFELCRTACEKYGWYNRNSGTNPFLVEGKKTAGLEIAEQFGAAIPDWVVISVGDGCTIGGIGKGLQEMRAFGFIPRVPRLLGVQAAGAQPIVRAFASNQDLVPVTPMTVADSIAVGTPRNWRRALTQIRASAGSMIAVTDEEILEAMQLTARHGAVFGEPAGVAGVAGLRKAIAEGLVGRKESALVVITGSGLKDIRAARAAAGRPIECTPDIDELAQALARFSIVA